MHLLTTPGKVGKITERVELLSKLFFLSLGRLKIILGKSANVLERSIYYLNEFSTVPK